MKARMDYGLLTKVVLPSYTVDEVYKGLAANENVLVRTQQLNDEREKTVLSRTASLEAIKNNGVLVVEGANLQVNEYGSSLFADFFFYNWISRLSRIFWSCVKHHHIFQCNTWNL